MLLKILYDSRLHLLGIDYLKAKPLFLTAFMWFVMLHFSVGSVLWAAQAEVHISWTDVSCQRNIWTDPRTENGVRARAGLVHGVQEGGWYPDADTGIWGIWSSAFEWGKGRKKDHIGKASQWRAKLPYSGCQAREQAVIFNCQLYYDRPNPLQHCPTTTGAHSSESPLCTGSEAGYQKR